MSQSLLLAALAVVSILAILFATMWLFAMSEMKKKFFYMRIFLGNAPRLTAAFPYPGAERFGCKPGMRKIVLRSERPFAVLVGFDLTAPLLGSGYDHYGFAVSRPSGERCHEVAINTYLGNGSVAFKFLCNRDADDILVTSFEADQTLEASATYPGHWYQHLGFFA